MSWLSPTLVTALFTAIGTLLGSVQLSGRRTRRRIVAQAAVIDELQDHVASLRLAIRRHNDRLPVGVDPIALPPLPPSMLAGEPGDQ